MKKSLSERSSCKIQQFDRHRNCGKRHGKFPTGRLLLSCCFPFCQYTVHALPASLRSVTNKSVCISSSLNSSQFRSECRDLKRELQQNLSQIVNFSPKGAAESNLVKVRFKLNS